MYTLVESKPNLLNALMEGTQVCYVKVRFLKE